MKIRKIKFDEIINNEDLKMWVINDLSRIDHETRRIFFIDSMKQTSRGNHAHKSCWQTLINIRGDFSISVDDGSEKVHLKLDKTGEAVTIPPMHWCKQEYCKQSYLMVLCSKIFEEDDYIRNYDEFKYLIK